MESATVRRVRDRSKRVMRIIRSIFACLLVSFSFLVVLRSELPAASAGPGWEAQVQALVGKGAVLVVDVDGRPALAIHPDRPLIPASILKIVTVFAALETLGPTYRFSTDFYTGPGQDLYVVGRGDPYLVSEELAYIADQLRAAGLTSVQDLCLDAGFFLPGLELDGTGRSLNPYDAYNGALCVNFNTIFVRIDPEGRVASAEPQTPLTDLTRTLARQTGLSGEVRLNLADSPDTALVHAGDLIRAFLVKAGIQVAGRVRPAQVDHGQANLFYHHRSRQDLAWLSRQLLKYSNNFMANQVFLTMGAERFGPPADAPKARRAVADALASAGLPRLYLEEGSGLSRRTRLTSAQMAAVLHRFRPYHQLLGSENGAWYKTGTMSDIQSMAGYFSGKDGRLLVFVIMLEGSGAKSGVRRRILELLKENLG